MNDTFLQLKNEAELVEFNETEKEYAIYEDIKRRAQRSTSKDFWQTILYHRYGEGECRSNCCEQN